MILSGNMIKEQIKNKNWKSNISYNNLFVNPNSIDVGLSNKLLVEVNNRKFKYKYIVKEKDSNLRYKSKFNEVPIKNNGFILYPNKFYLGSVDTKFDCDNPIIIDGKKRWFVQMYETRSSIARNGLITHFTAGFGDYGFNGFFTLEMINLSPKPIFIEIGIRIGQIYFQEIFNNFKNPKKYTSKYNELQNYPVPIEPKEEY